VRDALRSNQRLKQMRFVPLRGPSYFSLRGQREGNQEKGHPTWRLPGVPARQVREAEPGFSTGLRQLLLRCSTSDIHVLACPGEKEPTSLSTPPRACRLHLTAAQGPRVEQRAIGQLLLRCLNSGIHALAMARTRCATAAWWREPKSQSSRAGPFNVANGSVRRRVIREPNGQSHILC
jgi:hypothetical protein